MIMIHIRVRFTMYEEGGKRSIASGCGEYVVRGVRLGLRSLELAHPEGRAIYSCWLEVVCDFTSCCWCWERLVLGFGRCAVFGTTTGGSVTNDLPGVCCRRSIDRCGGRWSLLCSSPSRESFFPRRVFGSNSTLDR